MGQIKAVFRDVKTEHLEKLFKGHIIAVHDLGDGCVGIETADGMFGLTETETALLRALTDLDVQRNKDIAEMILKYEHDLEVSRAVAALAAAGNNTLEKKLELEINANEAQRAAINEMRAELKEAQRALGLARQQVVVRLKARQELVAKKPAKKVKK
jgi:hypothetical protein